LSGKQTFIFILLLLSFPVRGQDPYFSQFFNSLLYLNPAYAGAAHQPRISVAYRNQMPALGSPYVTLNASYDQPVKVLQGGLGINIMNDRQGPALNRISADLSYAYFLALTSRITLHAGFQASYCHRFLKRSALVLPDEFDENGDMQPSGEMIGDMNRGYPDFAVGFAAFTRNAYAGISMHHLAKPDLSMGGSAGRQPLPRKLTVHGGIYIPIYEKRLGREALKLNPNLVYLHQAGFRQANYGLDIIYRKLCAGIWFRHSLDFKMNAFTVHIGYEHDYFRFGYSHDFNLAGPWRTMQNMGAHELTFLLKLENKSGPMDRFRTIKSPKN
jgi:type IX secretion system PorP/SprF family membrane protein